ncbi:MAG: hypothetical protein ACK4JE_03965 [Endomicrobiia bacterium]
MNSTLITIAVICLIIITIVNIFLTTLLCIVLFRIKRFLKSTEKILNVVSKIGSGCTKFIGILLGLIGKFGFDRFRHSVKKDKKEEKNV